MGLLPGLAPLHVLWAMGTTAPAALLEVITPLLPDMPEHTPAAAGAGAGGAPAGGGFGGGGGGAAAALTWPKLRAVGAGFWLSDPEAARQVRVGGGLA